MTPHHLWNFGNSSPITNENIGIYKGFREVYQFTQKNNFQILPRRYLPNLNVTFNR